VSCLQYWEGLSIIKEGLAAPLRKLQDKLQEREDRLQDTDGAESHGHAPETSEQVQQVEADNDVSPRLSPPRNRRNRRNEPPPLEPPHTSTAGHGGRQTQRAAATRKPSGQASFVYLFV
jgi:hypothetical protein